MGSTTTHDHRTSASPSPGEVGRRRRRLGARSALAAAAAALLVTACSGSDDDSADVASREPAVDEEMAAPEMAGEEAAAVDDADGTDVPLGSTAPGIDLGSIGRDVVVEMRISMTSDDVATTVDTITRAAAAAGGGVASSDVDYDPPSEDGQPPRGRATIVVKVPPERLDAVLSTIDGAGTVTSIDQGATDVTDQLVDLDVRIANTRASVERVRALLDEATDVRGVVELEAELTSRQIRLEQLLAQQRDLTDRVALSTVTVEVRSAPIVETATPAEGDEGIADAFRRGWDAFVSLLFGIGFVVAIGAPFLVVAAVAGLALWLVVRGRRPTRTSSQPAPTPATSTEGDEPHHVDPTPVAVGDHGAGSGDGASDER